MSGWKEKAVFRLGGRGGELRRSAGLPRGGRSFCCHPFPWCRMAPVGVEGFGGRVRARVLSPSDGEMCAGVGAIVAGRARRRGVARCGAPVRTAVLPSPPGGMSSREERGPCVLPAANAQGASCSLIPQTPPPFARCLTDAWVARWEVLGRVRPALSEESSLAIG